jgi:hypothetical protein
MAVSFIESGNATQGWKLRIYPPMSFWVYCWTPISVRVCPPPSSRLMLTPPWGSYCLLPRVLFYCTIAFALVGWGHKWLIAGALAASLIYSGQAAIHACLLAWSHQSVAENDVYALAAILSTSAIITVPLLNWSRSLRDLTIEKSGEEDADGKEEFSKSRAIIVYWGFLIIIGSLSLDIGLEVTSRVGFWNLVSPTSTEMTCVMHSNPAQYSNLTFNSTPLVHKITLANGTALQVPLIDADWAAAHGCLSPCQAILDCAIFRTPDDYQLLTVDELSRVDIISGVTTETEQLASNFESFVLTWSQFTLPFVLLQGIWAAAFGRRSPSQIRDVLYILLRDLKIPRDCQPHVRTDTSSHWKMAAKWLALIVYAWSLFVTVFCIPILALTILAAEAYIYGLPQSDSLIHVGSWAPWAGTVLVLLAALISKFHHRVVEALFGRRRKTSWYDIGHSIMASVGRGFKHLNLPIWLFFTTTPAMEWKSFRHFWKDPNNAEYYNRHGKVLPAPLGQPQKLNTRSKTLPTQLTGLVTRKSWWNTKLPAESSSYELTESEEN